MVDFHQKSRLVEEQPDFAEKADCGPSSLRTCRRTPEREKCSPAIRLDSTGRGIGGRSRGGRGGTGLRATGLTGDPLANGSLTKRGSFTEKKQQEIRSFVMNPTRFDMQMMCQRGRSSFAVFLRLIDADDAVLVVICCLVPFSSISTKKEDLRLRRVVGHRWPMSMGIRINAPL